MQMEKKNSNASNLNKQGTARFQMKGSNEEQLDDMILGDKSPKVNIKNEHNLFWDNKDVTCEESKDKQGPSDDLKQSV